MQAEHADNSEINGLSGHLIACVIVIQIALVVDVLHAPPTPSWPGHDGVGESIISAQV
jgi:hypothetical protein